MKPNTKGFTFQRGQKVLVSRGTLPPLEAIYLEPDPEHSATYGFSAVWVDVPSHKLRIHANYDLLSPA